MGGRGRGGGTFLTVEQRQNMGIGRGEGPGPVLAPPPIYPKMENPPLPLHMDASTDYMLILKKQFVDFLHDSPAYVQPDAVKTDIERYSDKYKVLSIEGKNNKASFYRWADMPKELRPAQERNTSLRVKRKLSKQIDVNSKLKKLEELEKKDNGENTEAANPDDADKSSDEEEHESEKEDIEDQDEEMDDNTDYLNNYFDNGEGFDDEDDNLDEGPVY